MPASTPAEAPTLIEDTTIAPVPAARRYGSARDLCTLWFGGNITLLTVVNGALATTLYGEPLWLTAAGLAAGNLIGAAFVALLSVEGPRLGVPQLVQTRAQFGRYGALLVIAPAVAMYIGFLAASLMLAGQSLSAVSSHVTADDGIIAMAAVSVAVAVFGYAFIHIFARAMTFTAGAILLLTFAWIVAAHHLQPGFWRSGQPSAAGFTGTVAVAALWQFAYAPLACDYSRHLPAGTGSRPVFWTSYTGSALGSTLPMILGALIGTQSSDVLGGLTTLAHRIVVLVVTILTISMITTSAMNIYSGALSLINVGQAVFTGWLPRADTRAVLAVVIAALAAVPAIMSQHSLLVSYTNLVLLLMYAVVPWTAINLIDFYLIRRGGYDVRQFLTRKGGYGRFNVAAVACYAVGIAAAAPFVNTPVYEGPMAVSLKGADISWLVCLAVVSPLYYLTARMARRRTAVLIADARDSDANQAAQDFTRLSQAGTVAQYQRRFADSGLTQTLNHFDQDYNTLPDSR
jgi:nucleobase:cation symporter-1, NCS1 family